MTRLDSEPPAADLTDRPSHVPSHIPPESSERVRFDERLAQCRARALNALLSPTTVLDVGCGDGQLTRELARYHQHVVAVEPVLERAERARLLVAELDVEVHHSPLETFHPGDLRFDAIFMARILEHIPDPVAVLSHYAQWLTANGSIVAVIGLYRAESASGDSSGDSSPGAPSGNDDKSGTISVAAPRRPVRLYGVQALRRDCAAAGLRVRTTGGIMFKPIPDSKMHDLPPDLVAETAALGQEPQLLSAELYAVATPAKDR